MAFVRNEPVGLIDRLGLDWHSTPGGGGYLDPGDYYKSRKWCKCVCKSISVTFAPGGSSFGGVALSVESGRFGNTIHVVHTVTGDPKMCSYRHDESGVYWWDTPYSRGNEAGTANDARESSRVVWGDDTFEYWDRLGISKTPPLLSADYFMGFSGDFTMQMKCTGTDGGTISSPVFAITGLYSENVP